MDIYMKKSVKKGKRQQRGNKRGCLNKRFMYWLYSKRWSMVKRGKVFLVIIVVIRIP